MNLKRISISILPVLISAALLAFLFCLLDGGAALALSPRPAVVDDWGGLVPVKFITVTSGTDPDNSGSTTCYGPSPATPCTLRRAIVEARGLPASQRPVLIKFAIPQDPAHGYDSSLGVWRINLLVSTLENTVLRGLKGGQIILDGYTQTGGRSEGPKIIVIGPGTGQEDCMKVGENAAGGDDQNVLRGLAFQNCKTHLHVNSSNNIIADNWFGLSADGMTPHLRAAGPEDGSGNTGVSLSAGVENNLVQGNVFLGLDGVAAALRGKMTGIPNTFSQNYVGTRADGSVPTAQQCTSGDWLGGSGISIDNAQVVENNIFAGLRQQIFQVSTQKDAIYVGDSGDGSTIRNNTIGVDAMGVEVGVCGRGIYLGNCDHVMVESNTIVDTGMSAISLNGKYLYDANTLKGNIIRKSAAWAEIPGNLKPEDAIQVGPSLPDAFVYFQPAKPTKIDGKTVSGTSGDGSSCPNCIVELFLDDTDVISETLQSLALVTADANGNWTATMASELGANQGIRTLSTIADYTTIPNFSPGTTTRLSALYTKTNVGGGKLYLPLVIR